MHHIDFDFSLFFTRLRNLFGFTHVLKILLMCFCVNFLEMKRFKDFLFFVIYL